ncbi:histidine kinase N-terminal domain-containing protein [Actinomyces sp. zg-332]|uniref:sensor histidine kinase n=1 Tax=Actinomyces sp. zg-332 TaxID=2708340 RepID=UPI00141F38A3|nr:PAS domain-containing sensor histidine kinase [Actinomyces sp. zg-332]QPK94580.1 histidine kinase N-terminal domain-containing protein [Actinomyces sp. zg-332]
MPRLNDIIYRCYGDKLGARFIERMHMLLGDWQVLADLAIADLILWFPEENGRFIAAAHCRPATGTTVHMEDVVGLRSSSIRSNNLKEAMRRKSIFVSNESRWAGSYTVHEVLIPIMHEGKSVAVISSETEMNALHNRSGESNWFIDMADILCHMIVDEQYPYASSSFSAKYGSPRVHDGVLELNREGYVVHASPNAISAFSRVGASRNITHSLLIEYVTPVMEFEGQVDESISMVVSGKAPWQCELTSRGVTLNLRSMPLYEKGERVGAILLCRDVTEMKKREDELLSKDATIREIHHRVKNNLQTVSALLRIQARRSDSEEVKKALGEAERRVSTIATVHQSLSHSVDEKVLFDDVCKKILDLSVLVASPTANARVEFTGNIGIVSADEASTMSVILSELVNNAVEHGLGEEGGTVSINSVRNDNALTITVSNPGKPLENGLVLTGLGTQIVKTLVQKELNGSIVWQHEDGYTNVTVNILLAES